MRPSTSDASCESFRDITVPGSATLGAMRTKRADVTPTDGGSCAGAARADDPIANAAISRTAVLLARGRIFISVIMPLLLSVSGGQMACLRLRQSARQGAASPASKQV